MLKSFYLLLFALYGFSSTSYALDVPKVTGYVNDYAGMISGSAKTELEQRLLSFEETDSTQIVIVTIPSLEGEALEEFSFKVAEAWKIGQKGKDNGIVFLVSKQDRKMRIEVGRGLEGQVTDLMAGRIIDLVVKPRFKKGDFDGGFLACAASLMDASRGEFKADENRRPLDSDNFARLFTFLMYGFFIVIFLGSISPLLGGAAGGIGLPFLAKQAVSSLGSLWLIILGIGGFAAGMGVSMAFSSRGPGGRGGGQPRGGTYGGGGGMWSSGGGGGFSGGGGSFGGGGASGSW